MPYTSLPGPRPLPLIGNLHQMNLDALHLTLQDWVQQYGPIYKARIGHYKWMIIADPALGTQLLKHRPVEMRRGAQLSELLDEMGVKGLFTAEGEAWATQRKLVTRTLTAEIVQRFYPTLLRLTQRLVNRWDQAVQRKQQPDLYRDLKAHALDVTLALAMGLDANVLESADNPMQRDIDTVFRRIGARLKTPLPYWRYLPLPADRAAGAAAHRIQTTMRALVDRCRQTRLGPGATPPAPPNNLLEAMIDAQARGDASLSDEDIIGNAMTMVFAGEDTTAASMAWAMLLLSQHPPAARRLEQELRPLSSSAQEMAFNQLGELAYTEAVVHETLRLRPAAPMLVLQTLTAQRIGHVDVPKDVLVGILTGWISRATTPQPLAQTFAPERWMTPPGSAAQPDDPRRLLSFGAGARLCPGRYLALVEMQTLLACVVPRFTLNMAPDAGDVTERYTFTVNPSSLPVQLHLRRSE